MRLFGAFCTFDSWGFLSGSESDVLKELKKVEGVEEASAVYGVYDIVARVKADTMDKLKEIVTWRIRRLDKVRSTLTMIVVEER